MTNFPATPEQDMNSMSDWFEERPINKENRLRLAQAARDRLAFVGVEWAKTSDGNLSGKEVRMLDYACGPGFLTRIYAPHVSSVKAVDLSHIMIEKYKSNIPTFDIAPDKVSAVAGNLLVEPPEPSFLANDEYHNFDLITVGAALHHFPSAADAIKLLTTRLRPGGVLLINDLYASGNRTDADEAAHDIKPKRPHGLTEEGMESLMKGAGLTNFAMDVFPDTYQIELPSQEVLKVRCFLAKAMRPIE